MFHCRLFVFLMLCAFVFINVKQADAQIPISFISQQSNNRARIIDIESDKNGSVFFTGYFYDTLVWQGVTYYSHTTGGVYNFKDILFGKINSSGTTEWLKVIGGKFEDFGSTIAIDDSGNVFLGGSILDTVSFDNMVVNNVNANAFLAKYNNAGVLQWVRNRRQTLSNSNQYNTFYGEYAMNNTFGYPTIHDMVCDSTGNVYMAGALSGNFGDSAITGGGENGMFLGKMDGSGNLQWGKVGGSTGSVCTMNRMFGVGLLANGNIVATGSSQCNMGLDGACGGYQTIGGGKFFIKTTTLNGACLQQSSEDPWSSINDGEGYLRVKTVASGGFYTLGYSSFYTSNSYFYLRITKHNADGSKVWTKGLSPSSVAKVDDLLNTLYVDEYEDIYVANGEYFQKMDSAGNLLWVQKIDSSQIQSLTVDKNGTIYMSGIKPVYITTGGVTHIYNRAFITTAKDFTYGNKHKVAGQVFLDKNNNCISDSTENAGIVHIMKIEPGNYFAAVNANGFYSTRVDTGMHTITPIAYGAVGYILQDSCVQQLPVDIALPYRDTTGFDFGYQGIACSYLAIDLNVGFLRLCNAAYGKIKYSNIGMADANNVIVKLKMPAYITLAAASVNYTLGSDSFYVFNIGTVPAGQQQFIDLNMLVTCNGNMNGLSQCFDVKITPQNLCVDTLNSASAEWDHSDLEVVSHCVSSQSAVFTIYNHGLSMVDSSNYRLFINNDLFEIGKLKLQAEDSVVVQVDTAGFYVRCEVDQANGYPFDTVKVAYATNCWNNIPNAIVINVPIQNPTHDENAAHDVECATIRGSHDPNEKDVLPIGITDQHYVPTNQRLTYKIHFQNNGNDTAFRVILIDTLSPLLNIETIEPITSSHAYTWSIENGNVLIFDFKNIYLPDSASNLDASQGYVKFAVSPLSNLPQYTLINNFADIYFDYNEAVRTNTVAVTLHDTTYTVVKYTGINTIAETTVQVFPNPFTNSVRVQLKGGSTKNIFELYDVLGNKVLEQLISSSFAEINTTQMQPGIYLYRINGAISLSGKLIKF